MFYILDLKFDQIDHKDQSLIDFVSYVTSEPEEDVRWVIKVARKRSVDDPSNNSVFFPISSITNHHCSPNAKFLVYPNHCIAMQSQTLILSGQEIKVSYVPTLEPTWKRRGMLYRLRLDMCSCNRCEDPSEFDSNLSALKCQKCDHVRTEAQNSIQFILTR